MFDISSKIWRRSVQAFTDWNFKHLWSLNTLWWTNIAMENHRLFMGKSTISMAIFNCYVSSPEGMFFFFFQEVEQKTNTIVVYNLYICSSKDLSTLGSPPEGGASSSWRQVMRDVVVTWAFETHGQSYHDLMKYGGYGMLWGSPSQAFQDQHGPILDDEKGTHIFRKPPSGIHISL